MNRILIVYDWKIIARDDDFRKYKKFNLLELEVTQDFDYPINTELSFGNNNSARIVKYRIDLCNNIEYIEAVALNKWIV